MFFKPKITKLNSVKLENNLYYSSFNISPLNSGQALTLGNSLRRTLLSDIIGTSIIGYKINQLPNYGCLEDFFTICLNLKQIVFKNNIFVQSKAYLKINGPSVITSSLIKLPKNIYNINPNQYICTITNKDLFDLELVLGSGKGVYISEESNLSVIKTDFSPIDAFFSPVKRVNFSVKLIPVVDNFKSVLKENLFIEIYTNGSVSPYRCLKESIKILTNFYCKLLI